MTTEEIKEMIEKEAEAYANRNGYRSDKEQFTTTPWTEWNIRKVAYLAGRQVGIERGEKLAEDLRQSCLLYKNVVDTCSKQVWEMERLRKFIDRVEEKVQATDFGTDFNRQADLYLMIRDFKQSPSPLTKEKGET